ncbi:MAG: DUF3800 domain-containing protein [Alphaproteobacteria bacterium]
MHLLFVDESGSPPKNGAGDSKYFVVGGIIIPENAWHTLHDAILGLKLRYRIRGEIKWRYFSPHNEDSRNPMRNLNYAIRNDIRKKAIVYLTHPPQSADRISDMALASAHTLTGQTWLEGRFSPDSIF